MATKVYKNSKNIIKFILNNNLLNAQLYVPSERPTYISITGVDFIKPRHPEGQNSKLTVKFETFDRNSGQLSIKQYQTLLKYMREMQLSHGSYYQIEHHIDPLTTKNTVNYIKCILDFPSRMIKHAFTIHKHKLYECKIMGKNGQAIYLLLSDKWTSTWITKLSSHSFKITKPNLPNFLELIRHHLINDLYAIYIHSKHAFTLQIFNSYSVNTVNNVLRIYYNTGNIALNLNQADTYLIDTDKHNPAFKINYPKDNLTYYLILEPIFTPYIMSTLLH